MVQSLEPAGTMGSEAPNPDGAKTIRGLARWPGQPQVSMFGRSTENMGKLVWQRSCQTVQNIVPSGNLTFCYGKSPFLMGKSTINHHVQ